MIFADELTLTTPDILVVLTICIIVYAVLRLIWR